MEACWLQLRTPSGSRRNTLTTSRTLISLITKVAKRQQLLLLHLGFSLTEEQRRTHELEQVTHNIHAAQMRTQQDFMQSGLPVRQRANKACVLCSIRQQSLTYFLTSTKTYWCLLSLLVNRNFVSSVWANSLRVSCTDHNNHLSLITLQMLVPWAGWRWSRWAFSLQCSQFVSLCQTDFFAVILHRHN